MKSSGYDIVVVGELNLDLILDEINSFPEIGKEVLTNNMDLVLGSSSAIMASNMSSLGVNVAFLGRVGTDVFGNSIVHMLKDKGINSDYIIRSDTQQTGVTVVMSYGNDRANITYQGAMKELCLEDVKDELLLKSRHMHLSSCFLQTGIQKDLMSLFKRAKGLGLTTSLDPQWDPKEQWEISLSELLPYVDFFMPNISELLAITKQQTLSDALKTVGDHTITVKMGTKGACLFQRGKIDYFPVYLNSQVVDTVGAGDSFNAGFLSKYLQGAKLEECMNFGSLIGAVSTTARGGTAAFTNIIENLSVIKKKFGYYEKYETTI